MGGDHRRLRSGELAVKAESYLETLCAAVPHRRTGSPGNREATDTFAQTIQGFGYEVDATPFSCLDYVAGEVLLTRGGDPFEVHISPYSVGCDVAAPLVVVSTVEELECADCDDNILLMAGPLCAEQLTPKCFPFYNPESHQRIVSCLEQRKPAAIIAATGKNPEQAGALDPFPLIVDGDFDVPNVFCSESLGERLAGMAGDVFRLKIDARRLPSKASNVVARRSGGATRKIVFTAHIDAYAGSPGALDNASGTVVLLLLAEMLSQHTGDYTIEIVVLNGEDHYSAGGQIDYLERYGSELESVLLALNVDGVGFERGRSAYSFYGCPPSIEEPARAVFGSSEQLVEGTPWFSGDHMVFVQAGVPASAFTSEFASELMTTVIHTPLDGPDLVDPKKLVGLARTLATLFRSL